MTQFVGLLKKDRGSTKGYQLRIKSNDIITMVLNSTIGSLSYYVNDVNYGVAFLDARLKDTLVRPAFSCRLKYCFFFGEMLHPFGEMQS